MVCRRLSQIDDQCPLLTQLQRVYLSVFGWGVEIQGLGCNIMRVGFPLQKRRVKQMIRNEERKQHVSCSGKQKHYANLQCEKSQTPSLRSRMIVLRFGSTCMKQIE
mgnify:CR=1 FL=1